MDKQLSEMNDALIDFSSRWKMDGDYLRCAKCKRPIIASRYNLAFSHADGCANTATSEPHPWRAVVDILQPIIPVKPGPVSMLDEYLRWLDFYFAGNGNFDDFLKQEISRG